MNKLKQLILLAGTSLITLGVFISPVLASSSSSSAGLSDETLGGFFAVYMIFILVFYCLMCLSILATFLHAILAFICALDISKRTDPKLNKELWLALIIIPGTIPYLNFLGGAFVSVIAEFYYLLKIKPELEK